MSESLAPAEQSRLAELEAVVDAGQRTFLDVGRALLEINAARLYRATHSTFADYLDSRWSMSESHGYRMIDVARVAGILSPIGEIRNEAQARELVPLLDDPESMTDAWRDAMSETNGKPTATVIAEKVKQRRLTADDRARILALHASGKTGKEIAKEIGFSSTAVSNVVRKDTKAKGRPVPRRRQPATPQTQAISKVLRAIRDWGKLDDEEYIPAPELSRRIRVLDESLTVLTRKRSHYYAMTNRKDDA